MSELEFKVTEVNHSSTKLAFVHQGWGGIQPADLKISS